MVVVECFFLHIKNRYMKIRILLFLVGMLLGITQTSKAQTFYDMSTGDYSENFSNISGWSNSYATGIGASHWRVASSAIGSSPLTNNLVFVTSTAGGIQKGTESLIILATGTNAGGTDLLLNFSGRNAGALSLDWTKVVNSANNTEPRDSNLKIQYSIDNGSSFSDLLGASITVYNNSTPESGSFSNIVLPESLNNQSQVVIRFYVKNQTDSGIGSRPKIQIDNILVTSSPSITSYALTYNGNGNTGGAAPLATSYAEGATVVLPDAGTLVRTGYTFGGWNTEASGTGTNYNAGANYTMPAANTTLYAKWECPLAPNGTIEFMAAPSCNSNTWLTYEHGMNQPQGGVTYFWQTSLTGEDTNFPANAPYLAIANGQEYYIRAFNGECWSTGALQIQNPLIFNPVIASISPLSGAPVGTEITITLVDNHFTQGNDYLIYFGSEIVTATALSSTQLRVVIPEGATGGFNLETNLSCDTVSDYPVIVKDNSGCN